VGGIVARVSARRRRTTVVPEIAPAEGH
jgi:hypothetical protein